MLIVLIVAGAVWITLAWLLLLSVALAARRRTPAVNATAFADPPALESPAGDNSGEGDVESPLVEVPEYPPQLAPRTN